MMKQRNYVAKYTRKFNKATVHADKKKREKNGYTRHTKRSGITGMY